MRKHYLMYMLAIAGVGTLFFSIYGQEDENTPEAPIQQLETPVLFIVHNQRRQQAVFDQIKQVQPKQLFIAKSGSRYTPPKSLFGRKKKGDETPDILEQVTWPCDLKVFTKSPQPSNVSQTTLNAISWFFEHVPEGIILEDHCEPTESFFWFCQKMLAEYREDPRVFYISGTLHTENYKTLILEEDPTYSNNYDYFFAKHSLAEGWATWKHAWKLLDTSMRDFYAFKKHYIKEMFATQELKDVVVANLSTQTHARNRNWYAQWYYSVLKNHGIVIVPTVNMVKNIGIETKVMLRKDWKKKPQPAPTIPVGNLDIANLKQPDYYIKDFIGWSLRR